MATDKVREAVQKHADRQKAFNGTAITYARGGQTVALVATIGRTLPDVNENATGRQRSEWADRDYLIHAADLILSSQVVKPQSGDQITDGTEIREVVPIDTEPCFRSSDPYGIRLRVHTKRVA